MKKQTGRFQLARKKRASLTTDPTCRQLLSYSLFIRALFRVLTRITPHRADIEGFFIFSRFPFGHAIGQLESCLVLDAGENVQ